ncbi:DNA-directed RNA polymerase subunit omega [Calderihabitans maritimus]|uniref:DNA-directed RNA polymerase subunit omega n=1 Tax=Calderihabitans maritimus TaxID=1246530 RepID=A0A1Z5HWP1_9FIRM|nr:DNA-directed RNA polymerase subunit omega [Calderihabitans maritimus]GAW93952.1 DNA-directed RNA polymerase subunit omega [Calderihabitans maritimus]
MNQPSLDQLMKYVDSKYTLVVVAAKRARMLTAEAKNGEEEVKKPVTIALHEIGEGKIRWERTKTGIK